MAIIRAPFTIPNTEKPVAAPTGVQVQMDLKAAIGAGPYFFDLATEQFQNTIDFVQSMYLDNGANANALTLVFGGFNYTIKVKANTQGIYPVVCPVVPVRWQVINGAAADITINAIFMNVAIPPFQWPTV